MGPAVEDASAVAQPGLPNVPGAMPPGETSPHRFLGWTPDGGGWDLLPHEGGVIVLMERAVVAEARIWLRGEVTTIEFWVDGVELPTTLAARLVGRTFGHPALGARHAVLACLPRDDVVLLHEVLRHLDNARTRDAGLARLIEGSIRDDSVSPSSAPADRPT